MALVLRKAVLPKNVALINKCMKGRTLATTPNKKNPSFFVTASARRRVRDESKPPRLACPRIGAAGRQTEIQLNAKAAPLRVSVSCPTLACPRTESCGATLLAARSAVALHAMSVRSYTCKCPCPLPCGPYGNACGCGCLPPPCNTPPRCVQFMTGYYYYPYGWWFCGPYHVSGTCCPVGSGGPCGPCGPCGKCCAPCCICPAAAAVVGPQVAAATGAGLREFAKGGFMTEKVPGSATQPLKNNRSGISKFFPFSTAAIAPNPGAACPNTKGTVKVSPARRYSTSSIHDMACNSERHDSHGFSTTLPHANDAGCPPLMQPRGLPTPQERDRPVVKPGAFSYSSIPNYKSPYTHPLADLKSYES